MSFLAFLVAVVTGGALIFWLECTVVVAWDKPDRLRGRTMTMVIVWGRAVHRFVPLLQAVFFGSVELLTLRSPWWTGVAGSAAILVLWLAIDRLGLFDEREPWRQRAERLFAAFLSRRRRRIRSPRTMVWSPVRYGAVADAGEAIAWVLATLVEELPLDFRLDGDRVLAMWWGPPTAGTYGQFGPLRVDMDVNLGRAVVQWSPDQEYGVEPGVPACHRSLRSLVSSSGRDGAEGEDVFATFPPDMARVTAGRALDAIAEYVSTATKPTCLVWQSSTPTR